MVPEDAAAVSDVYKSGVLAGRMWRVGQDVTFASVAGCAGLPIASTLPVGSSFATSAMQVPPFFAGLLPEGETRRRTLARALHLAEDDELGLLIHLGADTIGDVQVVPEGEPVPEVGDDGPVDLATIRFADLWLPEDPARRSAVAGVQPKVSATFRLLVGGHVGRVILKLSPDDTWFEVLENERLFMTSARDAGLAAVAVEIVTDGDGVRALAVARFDRSRHEGQLVRHAQEDASQVLGIRPSEKYDPDARIVIEAVAGHCTAPMVAVRDLVHRMPYS